MVQIDTKVHNKKNSLIQSPMVYNEIVHYLDTHWSPTTNLVAISQLDEAFGFPSKKLQIILVSGTSGKSTTIHYTSKLLAEEGIKVAAFYAPHTILYNERFVIDNEQISHKNFTTLANKVIQVVQDKKIAASTKDILTMMAFLYFTDNNVSCAIFENSGTYTLDPVMYCDVKIAAVTRIVANTPHDDTPAAFANIMIPVNSNTHFVSADQNKQNLHIMQQLAQAKGSQWSMPTRKLAPLAYPFEQLHGRCAALAQKIAHIYSDNFLEKTKNPITHTSLLTKPKGIRGRPTLEAKKFSKNSPTPSLELFWNKTSTTMPFTFQFITDKKPMILLDNADNIDALQNLFLGFRLLAYKNQFKNVSLILGCHQDQFQDEDFMKEIRYFTKKTSGTIAFCPIEPIAGEKTKPSWDLVKIMNAAKNVKIKAKVYKNFDEAFTTIKSTYNDSHDIIIIAGSQSIVRQYTNYQDTLTV
jgi:folylpolyglutamate synthase/dihydropteroate synthase